MAVLKYVGDNSTSCMGEFSRIPFLATKEDWKSSFNIRGKSSCLGLLCMGKSARIIFWQARSGIINSTSGESLLGSFIIPGLFSMVTTLIALSIGSLLYPPHHGRIWKAMDVGAEFYLSKVLTILGSPLK